jgi:hypothetical protein
VLHSLDRGHIGKEISQGSLTDRRVSNMVYVWSEKHAGLGSIGEAMSHSICFDGFHVHDSAPIDGEDAEVVKGVTVIVLGSFGEADDAVCGSVQGHADIRLKALS